jgi:hypothetical protein
MREFGNYSLRSIGATGILKNALAGIREGKTAAPGFPGGFPQIPAKFPHLTKAKIQSYQAFIKKFSIFPSL